MAKVLGYTYNVSASVLRSVVPKINNEAVILPKRYFTKGKHSLLTFLNRPVCAYSTYRQARVSSDLSNLFSRSRTEVNLEIANKYWYFNALEMQCKCLQSSRKRTYFCGRGFHSGRNLQFPTTAKGNVLDIKPPPKQKKKKKIKPKLEEGNKKVVAYATAEEYDIEKLRMTLDAQGWYNLTPLHQEMGVVLHATPKYPVTEHEKEILLFENGTVVFWDVPDTEMKEVIKFLRFHGNGTYDIDLSNAEIESMEFKLVKNQQSGLTKDILMLKMTENDSDGQEQMFLEKYTCSNILSQSVKLAIWEFEADRFVDEMVELTKDLREGKGMRMKRKDVLRNIGIAYEFRHNIHSSDLEDTPDFYWDREELELLYNRLYNSFAIRKRTIVMKEKLDYCCDLLNLIDTKLTDQKHVWLEWMIVVLIVVEVFFEVIKFVHEFVSKDSDK